MNWDSWNDFLTMGGYAAYVWGSLAMVAALVAAEIMLLRFRRRAIRGTKSGDGWSAPPERQAASK